jgi:hypothetical protein
MSKLIRSVLVLVFTGWAGTASAATIGASDIVVVDGTGRAQADLFPQRDMCPSVESMESSGLGSSDAL